MVRVLAATWALLLGMFLLMLGNGIQGTLLGVRGAIEGFTTFEMSFVMSAYFAGFLFGAGITPRMIGRVGHVRVFAALGSFTSAVLILYPTVVDPFAWIGLRVLIGFCFSGIYVTAESWLNNSVDNANRGKALSLYMIMQMAGIIAAQGLMVLGDPSGFVLFIIPSVLVSLAFAPILLSVTPTPVFEHTKRMSIRTLWTVSPLGCVGIFLLGGVFSALWGMASVYGALAGLSVPQISAFIAMIYVGGLVLQFPIGMLSDVVDRRLLILGLAAIGAAAAMAASFTGWLPLLLAAAFVVGGTANPLYSIAVAYTNDQLDSDSMAGASGGLIFLNGIGAISGPVIVGWMMTRMGPAGFWVVIALLNAVLAVYAAVRIRQRPQSRAMDEASRVAPLSPVSGTGAYTIAEEYYADPTSDLGDKPGTPQGGRAA